MTNIIEIEEDKVLQSVLAAQDSQNRAIATKNVGILQHIQRLERIGGKLDYTHSILEALNAFGGQVNLSFLTPVLADQSLLSEARKKLITKGLIVEIQDHNRKILKLVQDA